MTSAANYRSSWTKAESGSLDIHGQDLSNNSRLIWFRHQAYVEAMGLNAHINTSMCLSLSNPSTQKLNLDVVKSAIRQLRFDHPSIASKHGWSAQPPKPEHAIFAYEVPTSEIDMDDWLSTVVLDKTDVLKALNGDLQKAIDAITYELGKPVPADRPVFLLHYIPTLAPDGQHALVFYFAHTIFDAIGTFQIMELCAIKIAEALEKGGRRDPLPWGEEVSRLPIALVESARVPRTTEKTPEDVAVIQQYKDLLDSLSVSGSTSDIYSSSPNDDSPLLERPKIASTSPRILSLSNRSYHQDSFARSRHIPPYRSSYTRLHHLLSAHGRHVSRIRSYLAYRRHQEACSSVFLLSH